MKPVMYIANVNEDGFENNPYLDAVHKHAEQEGAVTLRCFLSFDGGPVSPHSARYRTEDVLGRPHWRAAEA